MSCQAEVCCMASLRASVLHTRSLKPSPSYRAFQTQAIKKAAHKYWRKLALSWVRPLLSSPSTFYVLLKKISKTY